MSPPTNHPKRSTQKRKTKTKQTMANRYQAINNRKRYCRPEQAQALIDYYYNKAQQNTTQYNQRVWLNRAMLIYTMWRTGRRISEILGIRPFNQRTPGLRPMDMDDTDKTITFHILKKNPVKKKTKAGTKKSESKVLLERLDKPAYAVAISYDDEFYETLTTYVKTLQLEDHERIFPMSRKTVDKWLKEASDALKLHLGSIKKLSKVTGRSYASKMQISAHSFRHGFAMNFLKQNDRNPLALPALQEILAHEDINVTKSYLKLDQEDRKNLLNKAFKGDADA